MSSEEAAAPEAAPESQVSEPRREATQAAPEAAEKTYTAEEFALAERRRQSALARAKQAEDEAEKYRRRAEEFEQSDLQKSLSLEKQEREKWQQAARSAQQELRMTRITHGAIKAGATDEKSVAIAIQGLMASGTLDSDSEDAEAVVALLKQEMPVLFKTATGEGGGAAEAKVPPRGAKPPEPEQPGKKYVDDLKRRDPRAASFFFGPGE